jgi:hypothetical protein
MPPSLATQFYDEGQELAAASGPGIAAALNQILSRHLGWPFWVGAAQIIGRR